MSRIGDACWIEFQKLLKFFGSFFLCCNILTGSIVSYVILIFNEKLSFARIEVFHMKIIIRRVSMIFYSENHGYDNAARRCLLD